MDADLPFNLPDPVHRVLAPLFDALPLDQAMDQLVVDQPNGRWVETVAEIVREAVIGEQSPLAAGLWLYTDQLDRSHVVSQGIHDTTGSYWHGIMHRREGDFGNSHYWFRRVGRHPAMERIGEDYDGHELIDRVEAAHRRKTCDQALVRLQRREWVALFAWCATQEG